MPRRFASSLFGKGRKNTQFTTHKPFVRRGASGFSFEALEDRRMMAVLTFRNGETPAGAAQVYNGTQDTGIFAGSPNVSFGTDVVVSPDQQDLNSARQGL